MDVPWRVLMLGVALTPASPIEARAQARPVTPLRTPTISVSAVEPGEVILVPGGPAVVVQLSGIGLDQAADVRLARQSTDRRTTVPANDLSAIEVTLARRRGSAARDVRMRALAGYTGPVNGVDLVVLALSPGGRLAATAPEVVSPRIRLRVGQPDVVVRFGGGTSDPVDTESPRRVELVVTNRGLAPAEFPPGAAIAEVAGHRFTEGAGVRLDPGEEWSGEVELPSVTSAYEGETYAYRASANPDRSFTEDRANNEASHVVAFLPPSPNFADPVLVSVRAVLDGTRWRMEATVRNAGSGPTTQTVRLVVEPCTRDGRAVEPAGRGRVFGTGFATGLAPGQSSVVRMALDPALQSPGSYSCDVVLDYRAGRSSGRGPAPRLTTTWTVRPGPGAVR